MLDGPFFSMSGPSFLYFFSILLFDTVEVLLIPGKCATCDTLLYSCSPVNRDRDNQIYRFKYQIKSTMMEYSLLRVSCYFAYRVTSWIPTASAVRYYTVIQPCFGCCGSLYLVRQLGVALVEFV